VPRTALIGSGCRATEEPVRPATPDKPVLRGRRSGLPHLEQRRHDRLVL
jgi:hypothetical protein